MADKPQAIAVNTNNNDTAGPPAAAALPIVLNIPAPIIAATPSAVKSTTRSVRFIPPLLSDNRLASFRMFETVFFRNKFSSLTGRMYKGKNKEKSTSEKVSHLSNHNRNKYFLLIAIA